MQQDKSTTPRANAKIDNIARHFMAIATKHGGRLTRERICILQAICNMTGHFLPEELAHRLQKRGHRISLTTIYRNLPLLIEAGIIRRACLQDEEQGGGIRYEIVWGQVHHDHLICSECGKSVEFSYQAIDALQEVVAANHGFTLERHHLELIGRCPKCQRKNQEVTSCTRRS